MTVPDRPEMSSQPHADGMEYADFFERFGGSYRTRHIDLGRGRATAAKLRSGARVERLMRRGRRVVKRLKEDPGAATNRFAGRQLRTMTRADVRRPEPNPRPYRLPTQSGLPAEFIRLDPWEGEYLFMLAALATRGIVETGRLRGGSTFLMACANYGVPITSVDIAPKDDAELNNHMAREGVGRNVTLVVGDSQNTYYEQVEEFDLLFVDGDHSYQGCLADLHNWFPRLAPSGHVVIHDSYFGGAVQPAVIDFLKEHPAEVVRSPYRPASYWHETTGSLAHFVKPGGGGR